MQRSPIILRLLSLSLLLSIAGKSQVRIRGTVYDSTGVFPLEAASVLVTSGGGGVTDNKGFFEVNAAEYDSVWFSYLGKTTIKFPVSDIKHYPQLDISLKVGVPILKEVTVRSRNYRLDSLQNRVEYVKVFNYQKPSIKSIVTSVSLTGIIIDINELIRAFQKKKVKGMLTFRKRLVQAEQDKFVDQRVNKTWVMKLTGLQGQELEQFLLLHRPPYEFVKRASEYDLRKYVMDRYSEFCK